MLDNRASSPPDFHLELSRLRKLHEHGGHPADAGKPQIDIARIKTCPAVFQPRSDLAADQDHVRELSRALKGSSAATLDPILVMGIGDAIYCIDGHHRLSAYREAGVDDPIPVEWFKDTLDDAVSASIERNSRDKLPMRQRDKSEAAWRLTVMGKGSKSEIHRITTVSERSVANMRAKLKEIREHNENMMATAAADVVTPEEMTWDEARMFGKLGKEHDAEWAEREAELWAEKLRKAFGRKFAKNPGLAARAIEIYSPYLQRELAEYWNVTDQGDNDDF